MDKEKWVESEREGKTNEIPYNHAAFFAPVIRPTMETGVNAFSKAALTFFDKFD